MLREDYLLNGPDRIGDVELLALLLGTGAGGRSARVIASELLDSHGDLANLAALTPQALGRVRGVGVVRGIRLHVALQLGLRANAQMLALGGALTTAESAASWLAPGLQGLRQEELHALYLDRRLRPICRRTLTVGNDAHTVVDSRQILRIAVEVGASAFVIAHNHPSGDPEPSQEDLAVTRVVAAAASVVGVAFLDHLVVGGGKWVSLAERGVPEVRQPPRVMSALVSSGRRGRQCAGHPAQAVAAEPAVR